MIVRECAHCICLVCLFVINCDYTSSGHDEPSVHVTLPLVSTLQQKHLVHIGIYKARAAALVIVTK